MKSVYMRIWQHEGEYRASAALTDNDEADPIAQSAHVDAAIAASDLMDALDATGFFEGVGE